MGAGVTVRTPADLRPQWQAQVDRPRAATRGSPGRGEASRIVISEQVERAGVLVSHGTGAVVRTAKPMARSDMVTAWAAAAASATQSVGNVGAKASRNAAMPWSCCVRRSSAWNASMVRSCCPSAGTKQLRAS